MLLIRLSIHPNQAKKFCKPELRSDYFQNNN
jgi:hypothetical protein